MLVSLITLGEIVIYNCLNTNNVHVYIADKIKP